MTAPTVGIARQVGVRASGRGSIVLVVGHDGRIAGASWGETAADCRGMGRLLDHIVEALEDGILPTPAASTL